MLLHKPPLFFLKMTLEFFNNFMMTNITSQSVFFIDSVHNKLYRENVLSKLVRLINK